MFVVIDNNSHPGAHDTPGGGVCATAREVERVQTARTTAQKDRTRIFIRYTPDLEFVETEGIRGDSLRELIELLLN